MWAIGTEDQCSALKWGTNPATPMPFTSNPRWRSARLPRRVTRASYSLVDVMREELPARHFRISMGIQTFSKLRLEQMGRLAFGEASTFAAAVKAAQVDI